MHVKQGHLHITALYFPVLSQAVRSVISRLFRQSPPAAFSPRAEAQCTAKSTFRLIACAALLDGLAEQPAVTSEGVCEHPDLACLFCSSSLSTPY